MSYERNSDEMEMNVFTVTEHDFISLANDGCARQGGKKFVSELIRNDDCDDTEKKLTRNEAEKSGYKTTTKTTNNESFCSATAFIDKQRMNASAQKAGTAPSVSCYADDLK